MCLYAHGIRRTFTYTLKTAHAIPSYSHPNKYSNNILLTILCLSLYRGATHFHRHNSFLAQQLSLDIFYYFSHLLYLSLQTPTYLFHLHSRHNFHSFTISFVPHLSQPIPRLITKPIAITIYYSYSLAHYSNSSLYTLITILFVTISLTRRTSTSLLTYSIIA